MGQYLDKDDVMKFECEIFSCFPEERETLFFGGDTVLKIKGMLQLTDGKWLKYDKCMEPINAFSRMMNGLSVKDQLIANSKKYQKAMKTIICDALRDLIEQQHEAKTPKYIQDLVRYHLSTTPNVRLLYAELMSEYQWLNSILKSESDDILNIPNIAVLFCKSDEVTFMMPEEAEFSDGACSQLIADIISISKMALDVKVRFLWPSKVPEITKSRIMNVLLVSAASDFWNRGCHRSFDAKSVVFSSSDAKLDHESQELFRARVQTMIQSLCQILKSKSAKRKDKEDVGLDAAPQTADNSPRVTDRNRKSKIYLAFAFLVYGYCRKNTEYISVKINLSQDVMDLILFMYSDRKLPYLFLDRKGYTIGSDIDYKEHYHLFKKESERLLKWRNMLFSGYEKGSNLDEVIAHWNGVKNHRKFQSRVRKGIPYQLRGAIWQNLCGARERKRIECKRYGSNSLYNDLKNSTEQPRDDRPISMDIARTARIKRQVPLPTCGMMPVGLRLHDQWRNSAADEDIEKDSTIRLALYSVLKVSMYSLLRYLLFHDMLMHLTLKPVPNFLVRSVLIMSHFAILLFYLIANFQCSELRIISQRYWIY